MSKRAIATSVLVACAFFFLFIVSGALVRSYANTSDNAHWTGYPLPPCFQDARTCGGHVLGTDENGRDLLARLAVGAQVTLGVSLLAVILELVVGIAFGALARYGGTYLRFLVMRIADAVSCFAAWPLIVVVIAISWSGQRSPLGLSACLTITAILFSPRVMRLVAAESANDITRFLLSQAGRDWASIILLLATVDFFGYGVQPPTPSWGNMLSHSGENFQLLAWWSALFPAVCISVAVFTIEIARRTFLATRAQQ